MIFLNILLLDIVDIFCIEFRFYETFTDINAVTKFCGLKYLIHLGLVNVDSFRMVYFQMFCIFRPAFVRLHSTDICTLAEKISEICTLFQPITLQIF